MSGDHIPWSVESNWHYFQISVVYILNIYLPFTMWLVISMIIPKFKSVKYNRTYKIFDQNLFESLVFTDSVWYKVLI